MNTRTSIQDAGEKLGGARKDADFVPVDPKTESQSPNVLEQLWPKPERWTELIPSIGARRAVMCMVIYENLAKTPQRHGHFGLSAAQWQDFYQTAITMICELLTGQGEPDSRTISRSYTEAMKAYGLKVSGSPEVAKACVYAAGKASRRTTKHPFGLTPIDDLRYKYLYLWGWGSDDRVTDKLSMGALELQDKITYERYWKSVKGAAGVWQYLDETKFQTEHEALTCTRTHLEKYLIELAQAQSKPRAAVPTWVRPFAPESDQRSGSANANASGKTEVDLIVTFGFRGVEFGNWVTQAQRQWFVDAVYDACQDLMQLLGMPSTFASLNGLLGLAYGSRGEGLSRAAAHFEPGRWVLHLTKDSGPGAIAHEFGHAWDCWMADQLWGQRRQLAEHGNKYPRGHLIEEYPAFMSEQRNWSWVKKSEMQAPFMDWRVRTERDSYEEKWRWVRDSETMDTRRKFYWSQDREMFARGFEVLVHDSLAVRGRHNSMLVFGVSEADGQAQKAKGNPFPYPLGAERVETCRLMAKIIRSFKTQFMTPPDS